MLLGSQILEGSVIDHAAIVLIRCDNDPFRPVPSQLTPTRVVREGFATCGPSSRFSAGLGRRFGGGLATCGPSSRFSAGLGRRFGGGLATCGPSSRFFAGLGRRFDGVVPGQGGRGVGAGPPWALGPRGGGGGPGGAGGEGVGSAR